MKIKVSTSRISFHKPDIASVLLFLWLSMMFILTITRFVLSRFGFYDGTAREVALWIVAAIPLLLFFINIRKLDTSDYLPFFVLFILVGLSIVITMVANPEIKPYLTRADYGINRVLRPDCALYAFLFFSLVKNPKKMRTCIEWFAYLDFIYLIVVEMLPAISRGYWIDIGARGQEVHYTYSLSFGYAIIFPVIVFLYLSIKERKIQYYLLTLIGMYCVIKEGNRGALILPVIFIGLMMISSVVESKSIKRKTLKIALIGIVLALVAVFGDSILRYGLTFLKEHGVESRTVNMLLSGRATEGNGRTRIWNAVIAAIQSGGLFGYGFYGDRPIVTPIQYVGYSHNLFLELIVSYGILGGLIILYILFDVIRMVLFCKDTQWRELYIIMLSASCQLLLSMSFWYVWEFWAAAAIAFANRYRIIRKKHYR